MPVYKTSIAPGGVVVDPSAPSVANQGTPGLVAYSYKIVAVLTDGTHSAASAAGSTATGAATLNVTDFNRLTWTDPTVAHGAAIDHIDVYRTVSAGSPATLGKIGTAAAGAGTFDDTGLAGDAATAPSTNTSGVGAAKDVQHVTTVALDATAVGTATYKVMVSYDKGTSFVQTGSSITADGLGAVVPDAADQVRLDCTSYTSGSPKFGIRGYK